MDRVVMGHQVATVLHKTPMGEAAMGRLQGALGRILMTDRAILSLVPMVGWLTELKTPAKFTTTTTTVASHSGTGHLNGVPCEEHTLESAAAHVIGSAAGRSSSGAAGHCVDWQGMSCGEGRAQEVQHPAKLGTMQSWGVAGIV